MRGGPLVTEGCIDTKEYRGPTPDRHNKPKFSLQYFAPENPTTPLPNISQTYQRLQEALSSYCHHKPPHDNSSFLYIGDDLRPL